MYDRKEFKFLISQNLLILLRAAPTNSFAEFSRWMKDRVKFYLKTNKTTWLLCWCVCEQEGRAENWTDKHKQEK